MSSAMYRPFCVGLSVLAFPHFCPSLCSQAVRSTAAAIGEGSRRISANCLKHTPGNILQCQKLGKNIYRSDKLLSSSTVRYFSKSSIPNETTFVKYCLSQWISKLSGSFEIHWVKQYLVNFTGLVGLLNATVYKTEPIFTGLGHGKFS